MAYPDYIREKAQWLRVERRMTLDDIAERLDVPKTTVWYWIRDLDVEPAPRAPGCKPRQDPATVRKRAESNRATWAARRAEAYREGWEKYEGLIAEPGFRDFICMYIGEGYKKNRNCVSIGNSDPRVISLATSWILRLSSDRKVSFSVQYHADQDIERLKRFWAFRVGVEPDEIRLQRKSNSGQLKGRNWRSKWGVLTVTVGDTYLRSRLQAWMDRVQASWLESVADGV